MVPGDVPPKRKRQVLFLRGVTFSVFLPSLGYYAILVEFSLGQANGIQFGNFGQMSKFGNCCKKTHFFKSLTRERENLALSRRRQLKALLMEKLI